MAIASQQASPGRRAMLAKVHLAAKDLRLDDDARRDVLERVTGHRSAADCSDAQLVSVLNEFRRLGWKPDFGQITRDRAAAASPARPKPAMTPLALKARAMWKSLWNLGAVRSGDERALEAFAKRQLGVDRLQWADAAIAYRLIEALKGMAERAGWPQDLAGVTKGQEVLSLKRRLVQRQAELLGVEPFRLSGLTERQIEQLAIENGKRIREARKE